MENYNGGDYTDFCASWIGSFHFMESSKSVCCSRFIDVHEILSMRYGRCCEFIFPSYWRFLILLVSPTQLQPKSRLTLFRFVFAQSNEVAGISLPDESDEELFKILLTIAFIFKFISIIQMIISQTSVDLFFIDWEREKPIAEGDQGMSN